MLAPRPAQPGSPFPQKEGALFLPFLARFLLNSVRVQVMETCRGMVPLLDSKGDAMLKEIVFWMAVAVQSWIIFWCLVGALCPGWSRK